jgi:flagellar basal body-associated protein FliL
MKKNKPIIFSIIAVLVLACAVVNYLGYQQTLKEDPNFWQEVRTQQNDPVYQAQKQAENDAEADKALPYMIGAFFLFCVFVFGGEVVKALGKPLLIVMVGIVLLGAIAYFFGWSDKNNDGTNDVQIVKMVQPTGADANNDKAYSEVNKNNADATMKNSVSLVIVWVAFGIVVFMFGFMAQFFKKD